mmetsp:Transcript_9749/g.26495  ORF Transcript_9749/g.26495 Transcript_9749/m.26495 type:complete len:204 (+) Transcript_9749:303-914(+)
MHINPEKDDMLRLLAQIRSLEAELDDAKRQRELLQQEASSLFSAMLKACHVLNALVRGRGCMRQSDPMPARECRRELQLLAAECAQADACSSADPESSADRGPHLEGHPAGAHDAAPAAAPHTLRTSTYLDQLQQLTTSPGRCAPAAREERDNTLDAMAPVVMRDAAENDERLASATDDLVAYMEVEHRTRLTPDVQRRYGLQ